MHGSALGVNMSQNRELVSCGSSTQTSSQIIIRSLKHTLLLLVVANAANVSQVTAASQSESRGVFNPFMYIVDLLNSRQRPEKARYVNFGQVPLSETIAHDHDSGSTSTSVLPAILVTACVSRPACDCYREGRPLRNKRSSAHHWGCWLKRK